MKARDMLIIVTTVVVGIALGSLAGKYIIKHSEVVDDNRKLQSEIAYLNSRIKDNDERAFRSAMSMKAYYEMQIQDNEDTLKKVDEANQELVTKLSKAGVENIQLMEKVEVLTARLHHKKIKRKEVQ
jgi:predicted RNase H-like nuclease (RuvC/YqgF family)